MTHAGNEQHPHRGEDRPALALVAHHAAEHVGQRRTDREDQHICTRLRERRRIFIGMRRVGVEEPAAIGAEHLDGYLRGHGPLRDHLLARLRALSHRYRR